MAFVKVRFCSVFDLFWLANVLLGFGRGGERRLLGVLHFVVCFAAFLFFYDFDDG